MRHSLSDPGTKLDPFNQNGEQHNRYNFIFGAAQLLLFETVQDNVMLVDELLTENITIVKYCLWRRQHKINIVIFWLF